jgi:hypothetical protein
LRSSTIAVRRQRIVSGENGNVNGIPFRLAERLALALDAVVARRRLDREPDGFESADELANILSSSRPGGRRGRSYRLLALRNDDAGPPTRRAPASRESDRIDVEAAAGDQP